MSDLPARGNESPITSAIHLEFIRSVIDADDGDGLRQVESFHHSLFLNQYGRELERVRQERHVHEDRLAGLEERLERTRHRLKGEDRFVPVLAGGVPDVEPAAPWNGWDAAMFGSAVIAILGLLLFGVFNISFNLLESGIVTFAEHPVRAYLWAALLPVGALAVKVGWDFIQDRRRRDAYLWTCLSIGIVALIAWIGAYASIYPTLSRSAVDQVAQLGVFEDPRARDGFFSGLSAGGARRIDMLLVGAQALAEICLSAVLGMYLTQLYAKHRPVRLAVNPTYDRFDGERRRLEEEVARERQSLGEAKGAEARLEHQLSVFVAYARSLFQREATLRRDRGQRKRTLIEESAEELRRRLEAIDRDPEPAATDPNGNGNGSDHPPAFAAAPPTGSGPTRNPLP